MADKNVLLFVYKEFLQNSKENPKKTNRNWIQAIKLAIHKRRTTSGQ